MRILLISILFLIASCNNKKQDKPVGQPVPQAGEFRLALDSGTWIINIPQGYTIEDSTAYMQRLAKTPNQQPNPGEESATLLYVYKPGSLGDTIHYALLLSKFPWPDTAILQHHIQTGVNYMIKTLNLDSAFQYLLTQRLVTDTIGGQQFIVEEYDVLRGKDTVLFRNYNAIRGRQLLTANLHFYKKYTVGVQLKKVLEASKFE